jgi:hypothetical protein
LKIFNQVTDEIDGALGDEKGVVEVILKKSYSLSVLFSLTIKRREVVSHAK